MTDDIFADLKYMQPGETGAAERMLLAIGELEANPAWRHMRAMFERDAANMRAGLIHETDPVKIGRLQGGARNMADVLGWADARMRICKQVLGKKES